MNSQRLKPRIVDALQLSLEWFAARLGKVTASKVSLVMGYYMPAKKGLADMIDLAIAEHKEMGTDQEVIDRLTKDYPLELMLSAGLELKEHTSRMNYRQALVGERLTKLPADPDPYVTEAMKWGQVTESLAKARYQLKNRTIIEDAPLMLHPEWDCGASPDGLVIDPETGLLGNLEVKCLKSANHLYKVIKPQAVPEEHIPQIQMQMWINGRDFCDFIGFDSRVPEGLEIFSTRMERDDFYIDYVLAPAVRRFLDECDRDFKYFWAKVKNKSLAKLTTIGGDRE